MTNTNRAATDDKITRDDLVDMSNGREPRTLTRQLVLSDSDRGLS